MWSCHPVSSQQMNCGTERRQQGHPPCLRRKVISAVPTSPPPIVGVREGKCELDQETPQPEAVASFHLLAESESQASTLDLTECPRLAGLQEVQPPLAFPHPSQTLYMHTHTFAYTYIRVHT